MWAPATVDHDVVIFILGAERARQRGSGGCHPACSPSPPTRPKN